MVKRSVSQEGKGRGEVIERESGVETDRDRQRGEGIRNGDG